MIKIKFKIPEGFICANDYLKYTAFEGIARRYKKEKEAGDDKWKNIIEKLEYELEIISKGDFSDYILAAADFINWARENDISVGLGTGNVPSSITAYALRMSDIDPVKYDLFFERLINPERILAPILHFDFGIEGIDKLAAYIGDKYGKESIGQIRIINTENDYNLYDCKPEKFCLFGKQALDINKHAVNLIRKRGGAYSNFNIENIPEDDPAAFKVFQEGNTDDIFWFDSDTTKEFLKEANPKTIHDLMIIYSLNRPAVIQQIPQYIACKNGKQEIVYSDPCMEDILRNTYGIIIYHEQAIQIIQRISGFTLGRADIFRKAAGRKSLLSVYREEEKAFIEGAVKRGFSAEKIGSILDVLKSSYLNTFPKSHAAAEAIQSYRSAYLKANFPQEFKAATRS